MPDELGDNATLVRDAMSIEARWRDLTSSPGPGDGSRRLKLGTVAVIKHGAAQSIYAFNTFLSLPTGQDGAALTIASYSGHGTCLDGMDRGSVRFESRAPWTTATTAERQFDLRGDIVWSDRFNEQLIVPLRLTGVLRGDGSLDRVWSSWIAVADYDPSASEELLMEVPAAW